MWTWMGGSAASTGCTTYQLGVVICAGPPGVYGTLGTATAGSIPGGRAVAASWLDTSGNLWLFGGQGYDSADNQGNLNDLWMFNAATSNWTWLGGNATESDCGILMEGNTFCKGQPGEYGTLGVPGPGNDPGARFGGATWVDRQGNFWLFGGYGADSTGHGMGVLNDLWEYQQTTSALPAAASPTFTPTQGVYPSSQTVTLSDSTPGATIHYTTDGSAPTTSSTLYSAPITIASSGSVFSETIEAIAVADGYSDSAMASAVYTIKLPPDFSIAASPTSLTVLAGKSGSISVTVNQQNAFNSAIQFSCSGLPSGASCSFSPSSVTPDIAPVSTTLTVTASATTMAGFSSSPLLFSAAVLAPLLCCFGWRKRRPLQTMVLLGVCALGFGLLNGCSGGSSNSQPVTASVTVNATSGSLLRTTTFMLTVN
uniref:GH29D-like beta-sandwich domain-containing protein n=1 Tax=mine drainage metagenome TaxID=410659 RepID=E6QI25_9ZZZZ